jgi:primosomal protein N' (replication factor Y)
VRLLLLSATPSVESWWRAEQGALRRPEPERGPWPSVIAAETRGILRHHPLTLLLTRAIEEMTRAGRRVALIVARAAAALGCSECGHLFRCPDCGLALALDRPRRALACRLCARAEPVPALCPGCGGRRVGPIGWDPERVEASVARRFPRVSVSRTNPRAQVLIGTPALLRALGPGSVGAVGFVALDGLLRMPDFRAGERALALLWAAAEAAGEGGRLILQTLHGDHAAIQAVREQALAPFYAEELKFRAELGYPPFRRLCLIHVSGRSEAAARALLEDCRRALEGLEDLTVYPPAPIGTRPRRWRLVVKGPEALPERLAPLLRPLVERPRRGGAVVEVEVDPVSWT